jgi:hypothetical protein
VTVAISVATYGSRGENVLDLGEREQPDYASGGAMTSVAIAIGLLVLWQGALTINFPIPIDWMRALVQAREE